MEPDRHRRGAGEADDRAVDGKARVGIEDFRAGLAEHENGEEHGHFAARHDHDPAGIDLNAVAPVKVGRDRLAQRQDTIRRGVAVVAVEERLPGRLDDMVGRREVGLADAEIDDIAALGGERLGAGENLEGALGAEARHVLGQSHGGLYAIPAAARREMFAQRNLEGLPQSAHEP